MNNLNDIMIPGADLMIKLNGAGIIDKLQDHIDECSIRGEWIGDCAGHFYVREDMEFQNITYTDPMGNQWEVDVSAEVYQNTIEEIHLIELVKDNSLKGKFKSFFKFILN